MPPATATVPYMLPGRALGRKPATDEMRKKALPLRNFVKLVGRPVPPTDDYASNAQDALTKMMDNDREGCCVATALAKLLGVFNAYRPGGKVIVATDNEVSKFYHAVGGPGDNGLYMPDAFDYAMKTGFKIGGVVHKIAGYAALDNSDNELVDAAFHWFGGIDIGVNLTRDQYVNAEDTDTWDLDGTPVVGGHAIPLTKRGADLFRLATWARQPQVTRRCLNSRGWCDEAYVVFAPDWFNDAGIDVNNVNVDALRAALAAMQAGGTPDIPPDPNPPTPPIPPVPPVPGGGSLMANGTLDFFGQKLPLALIGKIDPTAGAQSINTWAVLGDLLAIAADFKAKNWAALAVDVQKLLADLGITMSQDEQNALVSELAKMNGVSVVRWQ